MYGPLLLISEPWSFSVIRIFAASVGAFYIFKIGPSSPFLASVDRLLSMDANFLGWSIYKVFVGDTGDIDCISSITVWDTFVNSPLSVMLMLSCYWSMLRGSLTKVSSMRSMSSSSSIVWP